MKRRQFVHLYSITALGSLFLRPHPVGAPVSEHPEDEWLASPRLLDMLGDERTVWQIGQAYRTQCANENDAGALRAKLIATVGKRDMLNQHILSDFESGRTIQVEGWILSITEVRQCALFSILYP